MKTTCNQCNRTNTPGARFCATCGMALGATLVHQKTLTLPQTRTGKTTTLDVDAIVRRARTTYGDEKTVALPNQTSLQSLSQRELIDVQVDCSGSMDEEFEPGLQKIDAAIRAAVNLVLQKNRVDPRDEIGVTTFTNKARTILDLLPVGAHKPQVIAAIQALSAGGGTDLNAPVKARLSSFDWHRTDVVRRIVMLTDGHGGRPEHTAHALKQRGVVIDVIAIGPSSTGVNEKLLRIVASPGHYRFIRDQQTLVQHYTQLAGKTSTSLMPR